MATKINDPISVNAMLSGNLLERLRFAFLSDPATFIQMFNDIGIAVDKNNILSELIMLESFHTKGYDVRGDLKDPKGKQIIFNISDMINKMVPKTNSKIAVY